MGVAPVDGTVAWDAWTMGWVGALGLAFANAALHRGYGGRLPELSADQVACVVLLVLILPWTVHVERHQPLVELRDAVLVGLAWAGATVAFELGFGHWVNRVGWADLRAAYDLRSGRLWALDVLGIALAPAAARWWNGRSSRRPVLVVRLPRGWDLIVPASAGAPGPTG
ncbi:hypothetical protein GCM10027601_30600 [Nocardioides ungokensis]